MLESTVNALNILSGIGAGALTKPVRKARRSQSVESSVGGIGVASAQGLGNTSSIQTLPGDIVDSMRDAALVELILGGEQELFSTLVERYKDAVQNLAYRMLGNVTEAEDITQETFVRAYTQL